MSLRILAVVVFAFLAQLSLGQKLKPGYIVTQQSDTVHGFIKEGMDSELTSQVFFATKSIYDSLKPYFPNDLKGFAFGYGRVFKAIKVPNVKTVEDDYSFFFVKRVISGHIDVYDFATKQGRSNLFLENNVTHDFVILIDPKDSILYQEDGTRYIVEDKRYVSELNKIKKSVSEEKPINRDFNYTENGIKSHITKFNKAYPFGYSTSKYEQYHTQSFEFFYGWFPNHSKVKGQTISFLWHRHSPERNRTVSLIRGLMYNSWTKNNQRIARGSQLFRAQTFELLPVGIHVHTDTNETFGFYAYLIPGIGYDKSVYEEYENFTKTGETAVSDMYASIKMGVGFRVRLNKTLLLTEVAPLGTNGIFLKFGIGFH